MAAVEAQHVRTKSARPWLSWPLAWQVASVTALIVLRRGHWAAVAGHAVSGSAVHSICPRRRHDTDGRCREQGGRGRERDAHRLARVRAAAGGVCAGAGSRDVCGVRHVRRGARARSPGRGFTDMKSIVAMVALGAAVLVASGSGDLHAQSAARSGLRASVAVTTAARVAQDTTLLEVTQRRLGPRGMVPRTCFASARTTRSSRARRCAKSSSSSALRSSRATSGAT